MKKAILTVLAMLMLIIPAYAAEGDPSIQQEQDKEPVIVASLEELQAAVDVAEDGDTIYISGCIYISGELQTDKDITLTRTDIFCTGNLFIMYDDSLIDGFTIVEKSGTDVTINVDTSPAGMAYVQNCDFNGNDDKNSAFVYNYGSNITVSDCSFVGNKEVAIQCAQYSTSKFVRCLFSENKNGAVYNDNGTVELNDCTITDNYTRTNGIICVRGKTKLINCIIENNHRYNEETGLDIFSYYNGILTIIDENNARGYYYDCLTSNKIDLPLINCDERMMLIYIKENMDSGDNSSDKDISSEQQPQEPGDQIGNDGTKGEEQPPQEPTQPPKDDGEGNTTDTPSKEPEQPTEPPQDDNTDDALDEGQDTPQPPQSDSKNESDENPEQSVNPPQEQTQPEDGENEDDPADDPSDSTKTPVEPSQDTSDQDKDNPSDNPDSTPDTPQKPFDSNNGEDDSSTPSTDYRPSHRPSRPSTSDTTPAETDQPQEKPNNNDIPAPKEQQLACNGAVIDTSRTVVLLGYGDGLLHEDDPLTRAQLATIIYRLLDDDSIASYSNAKLAFVDVAADAWYAPYVKIIQAAKIVNGIGDGKYDPNGLVCWNQILTILTRFVEPQECELQHIQYDGWATQAIQTAVALDWIKDRADFDPDAVIGRGELAELINSVLELYRI